MLGEVACNSQVIYEHNDSYLKFKIKVGARYVYTKHIRDMRRQYE